MLKKVRSLLINTFVVMLALTTMAISASAEWSKDGTKYTDENGKAVTGWQTIEDSKYYFNSKGVKSVGWLTMKNGSKYYFDKDGKMLTGWQNIDKVKYYFSKSGKMSTGNVLISKKIYLFSDIGAYEKMYKSEPCAIGDKLYYCKKDGTLAKGATKFKFDGKEYYFYFGKNGYPISTTAKVGKEMCTFDAENGLISKTPVIQYQASFTETNKHLTLTNFKINLKEVGSLYHEYECSGRIENFSGKDYSTVYVMVNLYNTDGKCIESKMYLTKVSNLLDEENIDFNETFHTDEPIAKCEFASITTY